MPVRRATRPNLTKIRARVERIRARKRFLGKETTETLNEPPARNFVARTAALPMLKRRLESKLKAVLLVGSAQLGVRKATGKETMKIRPSDLDLVVVTEPNAIPTKFVKRVNDICGKLGIPTNIIPETSNEFATNQKNG